MKSRFLRLLLAASLLLAATSVASAATISCTGIGNVHTDLGTAPGSDNCAVDGVPGTVFSNFEVFWNGTANGATVSINGSSFSGGIAYLNFGVAAPATIGDLLIRYQATNISGIDFSADPTVAGAPGNLIFAEIACDAAFVNDVCSGNTLANIGGFSTNGNPIANAQEFALTSTVYIVKDITYNNVSLEQFTNSHVVSDIPEPMTFSMVGLGLLGLGLAGRFRYNRKK